ncbi:hypothetical protein AHAS_Ahas11G0221000 [Arachis hypogaea]
MSSNGDIARCTDSLDASGELRVVVELSLENVVNIVEVGGDPVIEDIEVDASSG